jgi:glycine/D-amino acid oxidase-like deaminating enzyme
MAEPNGFDAAVIGAGLVGSAVALGLRRQGQRVVLLDEGEDRWQASGGNFGLVWVQGKGARSRPYAAWTRASADAWPDFARGLAESAGLDVAYRKTGGLSLCLDEAALDARASLIRRMHNQPMPAANDAEMLDAATVHRMVPASGPPSLAPASARMTATPTRSRCFGRCRRPSSGGWHHPPGRAGRYHPGE